ncbi:hypothetical protein HYT91_02970 [Candidatus Pacearchaeota archaeon]|nr:hypothetical protein [Candidatus Pacearchaeota archaeon]
MKTLKNLLKIAVPFLILNSGNLESHGQDTLKAANGYEVSFGDWQVLTYNKKDQLMKKILKEGDFKHTHFYEYDDKGQRIKDEWFIAYKNKESEKELTSLYLYNSRGYITKEIRIYKKGRQEIIEYNSK